MKKNFLQFLILILITAVSGCKAADAALAPSAPLTAAPESAVVDYDVYVEDSSYTLSLYEPKDGCYLGAYILSNKKINFDINTFEDLTKKEHSSFMYNMKLNDPFPLQWVLECYSLMKTPHIVIEPPSEDYPFQYELLESAAKQFGELYIPIFLQFYPNPHKYDKDEYIRFFREARTIFERNASNVAFVWSIDDSGITDSFLYYPSDEYVDWIGINIYKTIDTEKDIEAVLDYFYYTYQKSKPLMISQLGISHFTSSGHKYYTNEAAAEIENIYSLAASKYPRIKAINYMDFNNLEVSPEAEVRDNFSITDEELILAAYIKTIKNQAFLSRLSIMDSGDTYPQLMRSPFPAFKKDGKVYISEKTLLYDLGLDESVIPLDEAEDVDGDNYICENILNEQGISVSIDEVSKKISLYFPFFE